MLSPLLRLPTGDYLNADIRLPSVDSEQAILRADMSANLRGRSLNKASEAPEAFVVDYRSNNTL
jgi:hypothetical protein